MDLNRLTIRPLKQEYQSEIGYQLAVEKTKNNGIDEIFFEQNGKKYVGFSQDNISIPSKDLKSAGLSKLNGKEIKLLHVDNEINSTSEKVNNTGKNILFSAITDGIGGGVAGALVAKIGLSSNMIKIAAAAGFVTSFAKEAVSVTLGDLNSYKEPDWDSIKQFTEPLPSGKASMVISTTQGPIKVGVYTNI